MRSVNRLFGCWAAVAMAGLLVVSMSGEVQAGDVLVTVSGGGTADFVEFEGLSTQFSVGAVIREDGSVTGHFTCMMVHVVTISGVVEDAVLNEDGSVTLSGTAHGVDHLFPEKPFFGCPFEVTLFEGGPGVGGFIYSDCVVTDDIEVVRKGHIMITEH